MVPKRTTKRANDGRGQTDTSVILGLTVALIILVTMISVVIPVVAENAGTVTVTNETVTSSASLGETYDLDGFDLVSGSETVYAENGSGYDVLSGGGTDYTLHLSNGSITLASSPTTLDAGDEVLITYDYEATDSTTETVVDLLALFMALLGLVVISRPIQERLG